MTTPSPPMDQSNAFELPPDENKALIRAVAGGLAGFARWQSSREMHQAAERAAQSDPAPGG